MWDFETHKQQETHTCMFVHSIMATEALLSKRQTFNINIHGDLLFDV